jgi:radical SAM superfamily enzyme YgiQ (UPF0313 family)
MGFLERAGYLPRALDLGVEKLDGLLESPDAEALRLVAISVPMHTALHIGVHAARRIRQRLPKAYICFYGSYATLNAEHLLNGLADSVIGGEFEGTLVALADALSRDRPLHEVEGLWLADRPARPVLERLKFGPLSRSGLPPLERYARLVVGGESRMAAAVEASRGCLHHCRHCPIVPVYGGRFFVMPREVVLEDVGKLVAAGVRHVTFADPDFFNGPGHSMAIARALRAEFDELTFDVTTKVENILKHRDRFAELAACGCIFVVSAVESLSDTVLDRLMKGHTREDVFEAQGILDDAGIALRPSLVAFTPWTSLEDYLDLLDWIERDELVDHIDPVQLSIRLLVPPGSPLAELDAMVPHLRGLNRKQFTHVWTHPDPRMDRLHREVTEIVRSSALREEEACSTYSRIRDAALVAAGRSAGPSPTRFLPARASSPPPRLTEPWFC